jgi:D-serine deaminase-like pyridoxal phosphate-dependent protein
VQGYAGHVQHLSGLDARRQATAKSTARLRAAVDALRAEGAQVEVITGGGTGTVTADIDEGLFTELQPGSYVFMDREYGDALGDDEDGRFETSFFVQSSVISANAPAFVTLDAGLKAFATDAGVPVAAGRWAGATYFYFGDEQGGLMRLPDQPITLGDRVELTAPHIDPTVDRYERLHLCRGDEVDESCPWRRADAPPDHPAVPGDAPRRTWPHHRQHVRLGAPVLRFAAVGITGVSFPPRGGSRRR